MGVVREETKQILLKGKKMNKKNEAAKQVIVEFLLKAAEDLEKFGFSYEADRLHGCVINDIES